MAKKMDARVNSVSRRSVLMSGLSAAMVGSFQPLRAQSFFAHGNVQFLPDGSLRDLTLGASGRGNGISLWNPTTSQWVLFKIPAAASIVDVADNGSSGVRVTHDGSRPFMTGQWVTMRGISGIATAPYGLNVLDFPNGAGVRRITKINSTQFDVDGFTFVDGSYAGGGRIDPVVAAHVNHLTIDDMPGQYMPENLTSHLVGLRCANEDCSIAELVLDSVTSGRWGDYVNLNKDPETGINLLPSYDKVPLVGIVVRDPVRHIQGNASCILTLSWYNPEPLVIVSSYLGGTAGALNTFVSMQPYMPDARLIWQTWRGRRQKVIGVLHVASTGPADIIARTVVSRPGMPIPLMNEFGIRHDGNGVRQIIVSQRIPADTGYDGVWFCDLELKTSAGIANLINDGSWLGGGRSSSVQVETFY